jgi:hypothetical protein
MNALSLTIEITDMSGDRCDEILGHILATAFPNATAQVLSRTGQEIDVTDMGSLPQIVKGWITTRYGVTAPERPEISTEAIQAFARLAPL